MPRSNSEIRLPEDKTAATRWVYQTVHKHSREMAWCAEQIREKLKDAKFEGAKPAALRLGSRLQRMTPEKRADYEKQLTDAMALLGVKVAYDDTDDDDGLPRPGRKQLDEIVRLEADRKDCREMITGIFKAASAAGLDVVSIKTFLRMSAQDQTEICDWFDGLDKTGKDLGIWEGNFDDLRDDPI